MIKWRSMIWAFALLWGWGVLASAQTLTVPNPSFEEGTATPTGWTLSAQPGQWLQEGADGRRAVAVTGNGNDNNYWRSAAIAFEPSTVYRLRFRGRTLNGGGGTPVTGPVFCNNDLWQMPKEWTTYTEIFVTPAKIDPDSAWLRFGQWHLQGTVAFDNIELTKAQPIYRTAGNFVLGDGETVSGNTYTFRAPFGGDSHNQSRPLLEHQCTFNSNRWVFGSGSEVIYRHEIGGRKQTAASVEVSVTWYASGELLVEASADGKDWRQIGVIGDRGAGTFAIPKELLPADAIWVRMRSRAKQKVGQNSDPGSLQVSSYTYTATLDGPPAELTGSTRFVSVTATDPRLDVRLQSWGDELPGGKNVIVANIENKSGQTIAVEPTLNLLQDDKLVNTCKTAVVLEHGQQVVRLPYLVPGTGKFAAVFTLGNNSRFHSESDFQVADLYDTSYGELLPGSSSRVGLWWAESGWKVSDTRPLPAPRDTAVLIRAAQNEAEAAQLVVRPTTELQGFIAKSGDLKGPDGATIPAAAVDVLRERYVNITRPTDYSGVAAPWPDPLPPFKAPITLPADKNQPLWIRVKVPRNVPAGIYSGGITLSAEDYTQTVPLQVEVYDFALPDDMACTTAFGFDPANVFRYQKITDPAQRREVLAKYWQDFSDHHISPYDPAPPDRFVVTWPNQGDWQGGRRDTTEKHDGKSSLLLEDNNPKANVSANYAQSLAIPAAGFRLRFWYKTKNAGQKFIVTLNHYDAGGQWMSGRNNDMSVEGNGQWQQFDKTITKFPAGAKSVRLTLWAAPYRDDGSTLGTVWYDDVSLQDAGTGRELVRGGDFEPLNPSALKPHFDWSAWDKAMTEAFQRYHFNSFRLPILGMGGGTFQSRVEPSLLGYGENTPEYKAAFRAYCQAVQEHLREKGWLDKAYIYWFDEPDTKDYPFVMNGFRKLETVAPDLRRMLTEQVEPTLVGGPNIWCPTSLNFNPERAAARMKAGDIFWWYVCTGPKAPYCTLFIDHPATEMRVWLWQTWQRGIRGVLVWETNYWTSSAAYPDAKHPQDPYTDPASWVSGYNTPPGTKSLWGNGDGRFIYPPEAAADGQQAKTVLDGPVDTIRWEMLRDGIEDYQYLVILRDLLAAKGAKLSAVERQQYAALLEVPPSITGDMTHFTRSPAPIDARRDAIARAIVKLRRM